MQRSAYSLVYRVGGMVVSGRSVMTNFEVEDKPFFVVRLL